MLRTETDFGTLEISNDLGKRWVRGVTLDSPIEWGGGSLIPVTPRTINYPKEVVIGGTIPTDISTDPTRARQYIKDITFAYNMAAAAVNKNGIFPGGIQLRVEVLPVDPGGSGKPTTVTEVTTAFAKKDASMPVGVHDPSKCIEFGFPISGEWQSDPKCCSIHAKAGCSDGYIKVKGSVCGSGTWGLAHNTTCEAPADGPLTTVVGMVGFYWSANAITAARAVSNPYRLPMVSYDAWSTGLDSAAEFPYFLRVGPSNSDRVKVAVVFVRSMRWSRVAVVTDDDAGPLDFGATLVNELKGQGVSVLHYSHFPTVTSQAAVDKQGQLHNESVKTISSHLLRARAEDARVVFVMARGDAGRVALYSSLEATGFLGEGYAVLDGLPLEDSNKLIASGKQQINGLVHITAGALGGCKAVHCPHKPGNVASSREMNQAHDAVMVLATAIAPFFLEGGASYLAGGAKSRLAAMAAIRATSLGPDIAASGALTFTGTR